MSNTENEIIVGIADIKVGKAPATIKTNLGSCIAVCLYGAQQKVGGMLHLMLASSEGALSGGVLKKEKYADTGIAELLSKMKKTFGVTNADLQAKIFGGAKVLKVVAHNIGQENEAAVRAILQKEGIRIVAAKTGGEKGYRVAFNVETGKVLCQVFGDEEKEY